MANMRTRCECFDYDGNFIKAYDSLTEAFRETGVHPANIRRSAKEHTVTLRRYMWKITSFPKSHCTDRKPVWQWLPNGTFLEEYASCAEAERMVGAQARNIARCAKQQNWSAGGYRWTWKGVPLVVEPDPHIYNAKQPKLRSMKPVQAIPIDWENRGAGFQDSLLYFASITEACKALNLSASSASYVGKVLKGDAKSCGGFLWFDGNVEVTPEACDRIIKAIEEGKCAKGAHWKQAKGK